MENSSSIPKNVQMSVQLMFPDQAKEFQCPICAKYFSRKFTLDAHMLIHKGEKPHACPFCGKCFRQKGTLMRHKALHSSKSLFHCSLCNRGFRQKNVFLHHLKHRHNVSTESLDRRKYRTELKDYQSIMDTLPPFVHADSTAIASSEKHLDAMLLQSIDKSAENSFDENNITSGFNNLFNDDVNFSVPCHLNKKNLALSNETNFHDPYNEICSEKDIDDIKPDVNRMFSNANTANSSGSTAPDRSDFSSLSKKNNGIDHPAYLNSSRETDEECLTCSLCQMSFSNFVEFKNHVRTHVQSDSNENVNINNSQIQSGVCLRKYTTPDITSVKINQKNATDDNDICDKMFSPLKLKIRNLESKETFKDTYERSSDLEDSPISSKLKCFVCKMNFKSDDEFRQHSEIHDSYSLLKFISESFISSEISIEENRNMNFKNIIDSKCPQFNKNLNDMDIQTFEKDKCFLNHKNLKKNSEFFPIRMFKCRFCDKMFRNKLLLEYHCQLHLSTKPFSCKICKKMFESKYHLLCHTRLQHMKTYSCINCSQIFTYKKLYISHLKACKCGIGKTMSNGSGINFPLIDIPSLLNSDCDDILGVIPIYDNTNSNQINNVKFVVPVMSVAQIKSLCSSSNIH